MARTQSKSTTKPQRSFSSSAPSPSHRKIRLNKFISDSGVTSRRKADELIDEGQVKVNGQTVYELGVKVHPLTDKVTVKGRLIQPSQQKVYLAFFKPRNVVTSMNDPQGRANVSDYFKKFPLRVFPVGRLDWDTEGLLLMTNDGDFSQQVSHPQGEVTKSYLAKLSGIPSAEQLAKLKRGVSIIGGKVSAQSATLVKGKGSHKKAWVKIVVTEGKNRQVRRMFEKIGFDVEKLQRTHIGRLSLGTLKRGEFRVLTEASLKKIFTPDRPFLPKNSRPSPPPRKKSQNSKPKKVLKSRTQKK